MGWKTRVQFLAGAVIFATVSRQALGTHLASCPVGIPEVLSSVSEVAGV